MHSPQITALNIYPIKGLGGISLQQSFVSTQGLKYDRQWMLVDDTGTFVSQRVLPEMACFKPSISENKMKVNYKGQEIDFPLEAEHKNVVRVSVWSSKLKAPEVDPQVSEWFSDILGKKLKLVKFSDISKRPKRLFTPPYKTNLAFSDGYPILILSEESLSLLNDKCDEHIPMDRFRANIIIQGVSPHEEDNWEEFKAGTVKCKVIKPCARCTVITVDQENGSTSKEPLRTLAGYRKKRNKIMFGANTICLEEGMMSVHDAIVLT